MTDRCVSLSVDLQATESKTDILLYSLNYLANFFSLLWYDRIRVADRVFLRRHFPPRIITLLIVSLS